VSKPANPTLYSLAPVFPVFSVLEVVVVNLYFCPVEHRGTIFKRLFHLVNVSFRFLLTINFSKS
jgi:hypothetical protein